MRNAKLLNWLILFISTFPLVVEKASSEELLVNGGFETGDLSGWTSDTGQGVVIQMSQSAMVPNTPHSGDYFFSTSELDGANSQGGSEFTISQVIDVSQFDFISEGDGYVSATGRFANAPPADNTAQIIIEFLQGGANGTVLDEVLVGNNFFGWFNRDLAFKSVPTNTDTIVFRATIRDKGFNNLDVGADSFSLEIFDSGLQPGDKYHIVFVTSTTYGITSNPGFPPPFGVINGLEGADWHITFQAFGAGMVPTWNGVDLVFKAILSDSTTDARDRFVVEGRIFNTNGDIIAINTDDLWDGQLLNPILYDEWGNVVPTFDVWTGSNSAGTWSGTECDDWMNASAAGLAGRANSPNVVWIFSDDLGCSNSARLYGISPVLTVPLILGDVNQDGLVNLLDVGPFIDILGNGEFQFEADCNGDGVVNLLDVEPFIAILGGG